jgi:hypothetical protein
MQSNLKYEIIIVLRCAKVHIHKLVATLEIHVRSIAPLIALPWQPLEIRTLSVSHYTVRKTFKQL